jgi:hypothetical protein
MVDDPSGEDATGGIWAVCRGKCEEAGEETLHSGFPRLHAHLYTQSKREIHSARENDEEAVATGPAGNCRMVPGEPPLACGGTAEDPQLQTPGPLPVLWTTDELPEYLAVLAGSPSYLAKVAQPTHSWKQDDLGEICSHPTETSLVATADLTSLARCREPRLRNPLR